eukprot:gnl/TRDRNA2_/TRDRNA2_78144_c0_seq1.p1 gnl/TRDRNA2_/TRDRNA2_78144_c0~~gnl/TRDRNA2_/TRDRNA2_78144_c0_seq1.p1  ORF type:complete len:189 (-),score=27.64 gnl/TRDRNA2_/TRDRNA2_78144_c0_seq1:112-612(-)
MMLVRMSGADGKQKMEPLDLMFHMSLPSALILIGPTFLVRHDVQWPGYFKMTDAAIVRRCLRFDHLSFMVPLMSGPFAMAYNRLLYTLVQDTSASYTALSSCFNKIATICLSILFGFELLPPWPWNIVFEIAVVCSVTGFALGSSFKSKKSEPPSDPGTKEQGATK